MSMKNSSDTIGNRTPDLLACSAVTQPTVPPYVPYWWIHLIKKRITYKNPAKMFHVILVGKFTFRRSAFAYKCTWKHLQNSFHIFRQQVNLCIFKACCIISTAISTKCHSIHNFIFLGWYNTFSINLPMIFNYQPCLWSDKGKYEYFGQVIQIEHFHWSRNVIRSHKHARARTHTHTSPK
jgi:hypothetical protein